MNLRLRFLKYPTSPTLPKLFVGEDGVDGDKGKCGQ